MMLSSALYVPRLGFTSDDWAFLGSLTTQGDLSAPGRSTQFDFADYLRPRPVQAAYQTLLYDVFGVNPLGYHVVNAFVLAAMGALCYLLLRELGLPRLPALAVAVTFGLLPHYSTDRFWWAAFGYAAAMALAFVSIWADLVALRSRGVRRWVLKVTALVALALCGLGIEIALPLLVLAVPLLWYRARRLPTPDRLGRRGTALFLGSNVLVIAGIVAIKLAFPVGVGVGNSYPLHLARLALGSAATNFGSYGLGLPEAARWAVATVDAATLAVGVLLAVAVCAYLGMVGRRDPSSTWSVRRWLLLVVAGLVVYAASYGLFLTNGRILFTSTGINNRVAIAAAVGVALIWVGVAGAVSAAVPAQVALVGLRRTDRRRVPVGLPDRERTGCDVVIGLAAGTGHPGRHPDPAAGTRTGHHHPPGRRVPLHRPGHRLRVELGPGRRPGDAVRRPHRPRGCRQPEPEH